MTENPFSPPRTYLLDAERSGANACPVCGTNHSRAKLMLRWHRCFKCGNRLFLRLPNKLYIAWILCIAILMSVFLGFSSALVLRSHVVPMFLVTVGISNFTLLLLRGQPIVLSGWGRVSDVRLKALRDSFHHLATKNDGSPGTPTTDPAASPMK